MWKHTHIFHQLEAIENKRAYVAHNMDGNKDLFASLDTAKSKVATGWKLAKEGTSLLRKIEEEKEAVQAETHRLVEEKNIMAANKKKDKEKVVRLNQELQDLRAGFATQNEDFEADYQKQVDDMFFYDYQCCMKKHGIAQDNPSFPSDDKDKFPGSLGYGGGHAL